jgi:hypothetical protein
MVKIWHEAIIKRVTLDDMSTVYGAQEDPEGGPPLVLWFYPGDWCGLTPDDEPYPVKWDLLPPDWPESYRARIAELAQTRVDRPGTTSG